MSKVIAACLVAGLVGSAFVCLTDGMNGSFAYTAGDGVK